MLLALQNHPFCRFSDHIRPQVQNALLALKNRHDLNINLILFCYWFAANNQGLLSKTSIKRLLATIYAWQQKIILPLNSLCEQLKESLNLDLWILEESAYEEAISTLLTAEQIEQLLIAQVLPKKPRRGRASLTQTATHACLNVATYCQSVYISLDELDYQCLATISTAAFPELSPEKTLFLIRNTLAERQTKEPLQKNLSFTIFEG